MVYGCVYHRGINARRNGFHIDYRPWSSEEEEERAWQQYIEQEEEEDGLVDVGDYRLRGNGSDDEREPQDQDPHVNVDHFAEYLPPILKNGELLRHLHAEYGVARDHDQDGKPRYSDLLAFLSTFLHLERDGL